jgi:hypothetical protein
VIAVRVLGERGALREQVFAGLPVAIGRDPACDVVLFDDTVSRRHARLEQTDTGAVVLRDLGSRNGLHDGHARRDTVVLSGRTRCRVGAVEIEIEALSAADTLEMPTGVGRHKRRRLGVLRHLALLALGALGWLTTLVLDPGFWSPWQKQRLVSLLGGGLGALILLPVGAFALLMILRTAGRPVRLADTLSLTARLVWVWPAITLLALPAYYLLSTEDYGLLDAGLRLAALVFVAVAMAGLRRPGRALRFRLAWALGVTLAVTGVSIVSALSDERSGTPAVDFYVLPPIAGRVGTTVSLEDYLQSVEAVASEAADSAEAVRSRLERE